MQKILFLTQRELTEFEEKKSGISYLKNFNHIEFLNICDFLPNFYNLPLFLIILRIKNIILIIKKIKKFNPGFVFVEISSLNIKTELLKWFILFFINKCELIFCERTLQPSLKIKKINLTTEINPRITSLFNKFFMLFINKKKVFLRIKSSNKLATKFTEILVPCKDADRYIEIRESLIKKNEKIVFLDEMFIDHPDFDIVSQRFDKKIIPYKNNPYSYYEEINELLDFMSKIKKLPVVVCPHPKHNKKEASEKYNFPLSETSTLNTVASADIVVAHSSTSLNFAILLEKPIILYKSRPHKYSYFHSNSLKAYQRELNLEIFDCDTIKNFYSKEIIVNKLLYQNYIDNFLLPKGVYLKSYEILNNYFNKKCY